MPTDRLLRPGGRPAPGRRRAEPDEAGQRRTPVALTLVGLLLVLAVALALTVPWTTLPGADPVVDVARDFSADEHARQRAYAGAVRPPAYASLVAGMVVAAVLGLTPWGARLVRAVARPLGGGWVWQVLLGTLAVAVVGRLVTLPLAARVEVVRRDVGLSTQTWATWGLDVAKGLLVGSALTALGLVALVGLARLAPRSWWVWGAAALAGLVVAGSFAYPVVVEPVFNRFTSLEQGELREDLLELARREGIAVDDVLVADASRRTNALNAYVSGFGSSRRIVVYDTLLRGASPAEVRLVVAHELGHARQQDVLTGTLLGALGAAAAVCALRLLLTWPALRRRSGAHGMADPRIVPLVLLLSAAGQLAVQPGYNLVSRRVEARADLTSLELTRDVDTFIASHRRLALANLSDLDPHPVVHALFATHPSPTQRIALAREWQRLQESGGATR